MLNSNYSSIQRHVLTLQTAKQTSYIWTLSPSIPFDELLISWNAYRPLCGHYVILCSAIVQNQWSPWLLYAVWGHHHQYSFHDTTRQAPIQSFQDQIEVLEGQLATGFRIRVEACGGATLNSFYTLFACASHLKRSLLSWSYPSQPLLPLSVPGISQLCLNHPRSSSLCSPTSTTAVIHSLSSSLVHPLHFARQVYDAGFDIYGNWPFNIAQAFTELGARWQCFCARVSQIDLLWYCLKNQLPVIASIKGKLTGSFVTYSQGHLVVIKGYNSLTKQFICMDPAFPSNDQTQVSYLREEFKQAWESRGYLAYFFFPYHFLFERQYAQKRG